MSGKQGPLLGVVHDRPRGVFWAATGPLAGGGLCPNPAHPVFVTRRVRVRSGAEGRPDVGRWVRVYACAVCWPQGRGRP